MAALGEAGFEIAGIDTTIVHAKTQSDDILRGYAVQETGSGSKEELRRLAPEIGCASLSFMDIRCFRVPIPVGSLSSMQVHVRGNVGVDNIRDSLFQALAANTQLGESVKLSHTPLTTTSIIGSKFGAVIDGTTLTAERHAGSDTTTLGITSHFDNEYGYVGTMLKLARQVMAIRKEMIS